MGTNPVFATVARTRALAQVSVPSAHVHAAGVDWAFIGAMSGIVVAVFTGLTALVSWMVYRHTRLASGHHRRSVKMRSVHPDDTQFSSPRIHERLAGVAFYNESDINQPFDLVQQTVLWPRGLCVRGVYHWPIGFGVLSRSLSETVTLQVVRKNRGPVTETKCWVLIKTLDVVRGKVIHHVGHLSLLDDYWGRPECDSLESSESREEGTPA
jgi:hypothetical protein